MTLGYMRKIDTISNLIKDLSYLKFHEDLVNGVKIELINNVEFLARTLFEDNKPKVIQINNKLCKMSLSKLMIKVLLHELVHIKTEMDFPGNNGHGDNYRIMCECYKIPFYEKIPITKGEKEELGI